MFREEHNFVDRYFESLDFLQKNSPSMCSKEHDLTNSPDYDATDEDKRSWSQLHGSGWGKRSWRDLQSSGWGKRSWKDLSGSGWGKRGWQDLQTSGWGKRGWQDLQASGWGKRGWDNLQSSGWGKRGWKNLQTSGWGKRSWKDSQNPFGITDQSDLSDNSEDYVDIDGLEDSLDEVKRAWNKLKSTWGKRDSKDWASMKGAWGKRDPAWHNLKGLWGKRSLDNYSDTKNQDLQVHDNYTSPCHSMIKFKLQLAADRKSQFPTIKKKVKDLHDFIFPLSELSKKHQNSVNNKSDVGDLDLEE
ncbi:hypothetical protein V9T40_005818 [Parthenolecanium corni]|uniref:Uncharacterized protein n=1 Tax=Parthenolecanium corni TaxID=536013 RepID=A0AAN9TVQ1_9HEMI